MHSTVTVRDGQLGEQYLCAVRYTYFALLLCVFPKVLYVLPRQQYKQSYLWRSIAYFHLTTLA